MGEDYSEVEVYYTGPAAGEFIRVVHGDFALGEYRDLDIRDALFLQWQLQGAIDDYTKAAGR